MMQVETLSSQTQEKLKQESQQLRIREQNMKRMQAGPGKKEKEGRKTETQNDKENQIKKPQVKKQKDQLICEVVAPIDARSKDFGKFTAKGTMITMAKGGWGYLLMLPEIDPERTFSFTLAVKNKAGYLEVGIVDKDRREQGWQWDTPCCSSYMGSGEKFPGGKKEGSGYEAGDIVETVVQLNKNIVKWRINGMLQAITSAPEQGTRFVPFIGTKQGNCVEWLGFKYQD